MYGFSWRSCDAPSGALASKSITRCVVHAIRCVTFPIRLIRPLKTWDRIPYAELGGWGVA
jgi:hypothetical protein